MITIRELQQGDADDVLALDQAIRGTDRAATWDQYVGRVLEIVALDALEYAPWGCFVAVEDHRDDADADCDAEADDDDEPAELPAPEIIGFLMSERQTPAYGLPPGARIVAMAVHPAYRRQGIGSQLVDRLAEKARAEGVTSMFSVLLDEDERDAEFLSRNGFTDASFTIYAKAI